MVANQSRNNGTYIVLFSLAALIHIGADLPVHVDDGHAHFWPFSEWRYQSIISYWDPAHFGRLFGMLEALLGLILCALLWKRFKRKPDDAVIKGVLLFFASLYVLVPVFFFMSLNQ